MIDREIKFARLPIVPMTSREKEIPTRRPRTPVNFKTMKQRHTSCGEDKLQVRLYKKRTKRTNYTHSTHRTSIISCISRGLFVHVLDENRVRCSYVFISGNGGTGKGAPLPCYPTPPFSNTFFSFSKNTEMTDRMKLSN